jgi:fucose permease
MSSAPRLASPVAVGRPQPSSIPFTALACGLFVIVGVITTLLGPILPLLSGRWSISISQAGALFAWQFVSSTSGTLISGAVLSKRSFKLAVILGVSLCLAGIVILAGAGWSLGRYAVAIYGFGLGISIPAINLAVAEANPARRAGAISLVNFAWTMGAITGPLLLRLLRSLDLFLGLISAVLALSLIGSIFCAMPAKLGEASESANTVRSNARLWTLVPLLAFSMFVFVGVENAVAGWASSLSLASFADAYTATSATIAFWTVFLFGRVLAPVVLRYVSETSLLIGSILLAASGILAFYFASQATAILLACALAGLGIGPGFPVLISRVSELIGSRHPAAMVCFAFAGVGAATLPTLVGVLGARVGQPRAGLLLPFFALLLLLPFSRVASIIPSKAPG